MQLSSSMHLFDAGDDVSMTYAEVVLPLALPQYYTYWVPPELLEQVQVGVRVEVQFGKSKRYAALVRRLHQDKPVGFRPKAIAGVLDDGPIITELQYKHWEWISNYYCCTMGEVMAAALPAGFKLMGETRLRLLPDAEFEHATLDQNEFMVVEALTHHKEIAISDLRKILNAQSVYQVIQSLMQQRIATITEELQPQYKPKMEMRVRWGEGFDDSIDCISQLLDALPKNAQKQATAIMTLVQLHKESSNEVTKKALLNRSGVSSAIVSALAKKGIFQLYETQISRLESYDNPLDDFKEMSAAQLQAMSEIENAFQEKDVALLHGVTGSGKTRIYIEYIRRVIATGKQVLFLLPEIALTTQIVARLQKVFGDEILTYHSKLNSQERVETWYEVAAGKSVVLCARSGLFLPFKNLGLIIIDESHDPSYKQHSPAPRYNARDAALMLARFTSAKTILGTATPSIESYFNAKEKRYAYISLAERYGGLQMPEIQIVDNKLEMKLKKMESHFTSVLIEQMAATIERGEQIILFQNRRGYAPRMRCNTCGWTAECKNCDITLTYHMRDKNMRCHCCGYQERQPQACPACQSTALVTVGFGTEKIEDELKQILPEARVARMDLDTVSRKHAHTELLHSFEQKEIDILVGTQMVTKGLDFDNVGLVGVLSADNLLYYPDFRATERAFQLMTQVAGRAGRKHRQGKVIIQTFRTEHPVLAEVLNGDYSSFFNRELHERGSVEYPPYVRLIQIQVKHKNVQKAAQAAQWFAKDLQAQWGKRVYMPVPSPVARVRSYFQFDILIKIEKKPQLIRDIKAHISQLHDRLTQHADGMSGVRVSVDVDPY